MTTSADQEPDLLKLALKKARRISREEKIEANILMFEEMGLDIDDVRTMAESVGRDVEDLLQFPAHFVAGGSRPGSNAKRSDQVDEEAKQLIAEIRDLLDQHARRPTGKAQAPLEHNDLGSRTAAVASKRKRALPRWYASLDTEPPDEFSHGPLAGSQKQLASWLSADGKEDARRLQMKIRNGVVWARSVHTRLYEIWFKNQRDYAAANSRRLGMDQQGSTATK